MSFSSRGRLVKLTDKMEGFIDLKRKKKVEKVPDLPVQPAHPRHEQEMSVKHTLAIHTLKSKKTFDGDGPTVMPQSSPIYHYENPLKKLNLSMDTEELDKLKLSRPSNTRPLEHFVQGSVKYTTPEGLKQMLAVIGPLSGNHGCIVNKNFLPDADVYQKEKNYIVKKQLGKGSNGKAELCYDSNSHKPFVKKETLKSSFRHSEVLVPLHLKHENITKFYGLIQRDEEEEGTGRTVKIEMLLEYAGTALNHFLLDTSLSESEIWNLTGQGLSALQQLDYFGMVHLDVKPENLCVRRTDKGLTLKLTDFGSAKLPQEAVEICGWTPEYMSPESCKLVLQKLRVQFPTVVTQGHICGKVDMFAYALVVMYMYKRYHILQKVVTEGKTSYADYSPAQRQALQLKLMRLLATTENLVQNLVPDECDLDMRELLMKMTQHDVETRLSAEQALSIVKEREDKLKPMMPAVVQEKSVAAPVPFLMDVDPASDLAWPSNLAGDPHIPEIAVNQMDMETGPIKNLTKDKLRKKLQKPYPTYGEHSKGKGIPSKTIMPQTPVQEMEQLTLTFGAKNTPTVQRTEKISQLVTQPTEDLDFHSAKQTSVSGRAVGPRQWPKYPTVSTNQWARNISTDGETKTKEIRRVEKTVGVPQLCKADDGVESYDYQTKGYVRYEKRVVEPGMDKSISLHKSSSSYTTQAQDLKKHQVLKQFQAAMQQIPMVVAAPTPFSLYPAMESDQGSEPQGNLPNFDFL